MERVPLSAVPSLSDVMRLTFLSALLFTASVSAQTSVPSPPAPDARIVGAYALEGESVVLDGVLDEPAWARADAATGFVQQRPNPGTAASQATTAYVLYDGAAIYVGMRMDDTGPVTSQLGRRDVRTASDYASVVFDSYDDDRTAFQFEVNPHGVQRDFLFFDDVREDGSWDAVWQVATSRDEAGWTAEFRIPLSQLRYDGRAAVQTWGLQFTREVQRTGEASAWAPILPDQDGFVSRFGALSGLRDLRSPRRFELQPYVASSLARAPGDDLDPYFAENDLDPRVGLDVKYGVTSDVTLTATVNPDFGQVEADPAQVNLGGFELFFEERRPFFVEGTDVFSPEPRRYFATNRPNLLYTRRIGRAPQRARFITDAAFVAAGLRDGDPSNDGAVYTDAPQQSTILGAAKLTGQAGRFSFGVLNAVTGPEYGAFTALDVAGQPVYSDRSLVEPATNYAVGRARTTFGRTRVGALATSVLRSTADSAIDGLLPGQATVAGLDVEHPFGDWIVNGQVAGSVVSGSAESISRIQRSFPRLYQRPDADHIDLDESRTSLAGLTGEANLLKVAGEHWLVGVHASATSPGFDSNELGFQSRADYAATGGGVIYTQNQPQGAFQRWNANLFAGSGWNLDGDRTFSFLSSNVNGQLTSFYGGNLNLNVNLRATDDRGTRGGPVMESPAQWFVGSYLYSDQRKPVSANVFVGGNRDELGSWWFNVQPGVGLRPSSSVSVEVGPEVTSSHSERQYVGTFDAPGLDATFGRRYVFGVLDQTTLALVARADWTFTPTLSLQTFARPFVSRGRYTAFRQLTEPGQLDLPVYGDGFGAVEAQSDAEGTLTGYTLTGADGGTAELGNPNFTVRALQGNAVLRWEYRPGSALFFVWQQQRSGFAPDGRLQFDRDVTGLFSDEVTNVFLVKLSYWLGG